MNAVQVAVKTQQENIVTKAQSSTAPNVQLSGTSGFLQMLLELQNEAQEGLDLGAAQTPETGNQERPEVSSEYQERPMAEPVAEVEAPVSTPAAEPADEAVAPTEPSAVETREAVEESESKPQAENVEVEETETSEAVAAETEDVDAMETLSELVQEFTSLQQLSQQRPLTADEQSELRQVVAKLRDHLDTADAEPELIQKLDELQTLLDSENELNDEGQQQLSGLLEQVDRLLPQPEIAVDSKKVRHLNADRSVSQSFAATNNAENAQTAEELREPVQEKPAAERSAKTAAEKPVDVASQQQVDAALAKGTAAKPQAHGQERQRTETQNTPRVTVSGKKTVAAMPHPPAAESFIRAQLGEQLSVQAVKVAIAPRQNLVVEQPQGTVGKQQSEPLVAKVAGSAETGGITADSNRGNPQSAGTIKSAAARPSTRATFQQSFQDLVKEARIQLSEGRTEIKIALRPEHLGRLRIKLEMEGETVMAKMVTDSPMAKQLLEENLPRLLEIFSQQGIDIDGFTVDVSSQEADTQEGSGSGKNAGEQNESSEVGEVNNRGTQEYILRDYSTMEYVA